MKTITHNGAPCIEARVHMLPTEDASCIAFHKLRDEELGLFYSDKPSVEKAFDNQHLYITTDEKIKEGDWVYWTDPEGLTSDINQVVSVDEEMIFISHPEHSETEAFPHECKKIIATTDTKIYFNDIGEGVIESYGKLPQIPQSFIEEYCKAGGIDRVMVEYECLTSTHISIIDFSKDPIETEALSEPKCVEHRLKTDSNNCIIIHPVEENIYNVNRQVFLKLVHDVGDSLSQKDSIGFNLDKWIKENL